MKFREHFFLVLSVIFIGCEQNVDSNRTLSEKYITLDPEKNLVDNICMLIDSLEILPIVGTAVFGDIESGTSNDSLYVLGDNLYTGNIIITDYNGKLLNRINKQGENPDEYRELTSFRLTVKDEIEVYDFQKQRFCYYNLSGDFLRAENIGYNFNSYIYRDSLLYMFTAKHDNVVDKKRFYNDILVIKDKKIVSHFLPYNPDHFTTVRWFNRKPFLISKDKLLFSDHLSDTVYSISSLEITPKYIFEYKNNKLPTKMFENGHLRFINKLTKDLESLNGYDFGAVLTAGNDRFLAYSYVSNLSKHEGVYDINSGECGEFSFDGFSLNAYKVLNPLFIDERGKFISVVPLYILEELKMKFMDSKKNVPVQIIDSLLFTTQDKEQPIILKYSYKDM